MTNNLLIFIEFKRKKCSPPHPVPDMIIKNLTSKLSQVKFGFTGDFGESCTGIVTIEFFQICHEHFSGVLKIPQNSVDMAKIYTGNFLPKIRFRKH